MLTELSTSTWFRRVVVAAILTGILLLTYTILRPFLVPLIWAAILAYVSWPLHLRVLKAVGQRTVVASLITTLLLGTVLIVPLVWLTVLMRSELLVAYQEVQRFLGTHPQLPSGVRNLPGVGGWLQDQLSALAANPQVLRELVQDWLQQSSTEIRTLVGGLGRNVAKLFFALLSLFFFLRDGPHLLRELRVLLTGMLGPRANDYLEAAGDMTQAVVYALVLAAIAQGSVAALGYWIVGLRAAALLGAVTAVTALIPFGAPLIWASLSIWLMLTGHFGAGVALLVWGLLAVSWVDNIVRPLVISNATRMPFLLVVFGVLGGVVAFGLVGLFIGPVVLAITLAIWREWREHRHQTRKLTVEVER
ncbi:MAG: AI-2E family transporter [Steroidobacteraceae bacterium]